MNTASELKTPTITKLSLSNELFFVQFSNLKINKVIQDIDSVQIEFSKHNFKQVAHEKIEDSFTKNNENLDDNSNISSISNDAMDIEEEIIINRKPNSLNLQKTIQLNVNPSSTIKRESIYSENKGENVTVTSPKEKFKIITDCSIV